MARNKKTKQKGGEKKKKKALGKFYTSPTRVKKTGDCQCDKYFRYPTSTIQDTTKDVKKKGGKPRPKRGAQSSLV